MATYNFTPSLSTNYSFQPTFDGTTYLCTVQWNVSGQRFYVLCTTQAGAVVFNCPLIASPINYNINLIVPFGFITSVMTFNANTNVFTVTP